MSADYSAENYWQQTVRYTMDVRLDSEQRKISGISKIVYYNNSPDSLDRIYLHLYPKAFERGSVKHREYLQRFGRPSRAAHFIKGSDAIWNQFEINSFNISYSGSTTSVFQIDDTILIAELIDLLAPGDSLEISLTWTHIVGEQIERAGYVDEQFNIAQWYPKLVVYDEDGWHPDPYHAEGEFYGEFGDFKVSFDIPANYIIGASGVVTDGDPGWNEVMVDTSRNFTQWLQEFHANRVIADSLARRTVTFQAENVHDFAWIASPNFLYERGSWNGIDVHVLYNAKNGVSWSKLARERSERALEWLSTKFGRYPYSQVTVTDRVASGGMEYPMLVMNGSASEGLIVHEIGHIWFYGILANNEVDEAWLDEGFTTFQTRWYQSNRYPTGIDLENSNDYTDFQKRHWNFSSKTEQEQWSAIDYITSGHDEPVSRASYLYKNYSAYRNNVYTKAYLMLDELRYLIGDSLFISGMQTYYQRWHLKHVNEHRFISTMEEVSRQDLDWFFDSWLHDTQILDYGIKSWKKKQQSDGSWKVKLDLEQLGQRNLPLEIETRLKNGDTHRTRWSNHLWRFEDSYYYSVPYEPERIVLDPDVRTVDADYRNNVTGNLDQIWTFRWPGMDYKPRNMVIMTWIPTLHYHEKDGYQPGVHLTRAYGPWEHTDLSVNYALKTGRIYWAINGWRKAVHGYTGRNMEFHLFDQGGVAGFGLTLNRKGWKRRYNNPPSTKTSYGFYVTDAKDTSRTNLYDYGRVAVLFGKYRLTALQNSVEFEVSSAPRGWSDWSFSRLTSIIKLDFPHERFGIRNRTIAGLMWYGKSGVPSQERYTIEGAGSGDLYSRHYLRDESTFYGFDNVRKHYHLPGDANLRGYYQHGFAGTEKIVANSIEVYYNPDFTMANVELTGFLDSGWLTGSKQKAGDKGFDTDLLADLGVGLRINKTMLGQQLFLRFDIPFWLNAPLQNESRINFKRWIFAFEKGL